MRSLSLTAASFVLAASAVALPATAIAEPGDDAPGLCQSPGLVADPDNRSSFYNCDEQLAAHKYDCPTGTVFYEDAQDCTPPKNAADLLGGVTGSTENIVQR